MTNEKTHKNNQCKFYLSVPPTKQYLNSAKTLNIKNISLMTSISDVYQQNYFKQSIKKTKEIIKETLKEPNTFEEIQSGLYPISLLAPENPIDPESGPIVVLFRNLNGGCGMFIDGKCSIYDHRPKSCRQFDCRKMHHPKIPNMVKE